MQACDDDAHVSSTTRSGMDVFNRNERRRSVMSFNLVLDLVIRNQYFSGTSLYFYSGKRSAHIYSYEAVARETSTEVVDTTIRGYSSESTRLLHILRCVSSEFRNIIGDNMRRSVLDPLIGSNCRPSCSYPSCPSVGKHYCSACMKARYCHREHQKKHWACHKVSY
jgi:hypothetical protein